MPLRLTPDDLDLPPKFEKFRPAQLVGLEALMKSDRRFSGVCAPPGVGKSLLNLAYARVRGGRTLILTATKGLQQQYLRDAASMGMLDVRGQSNYRCVAVDKGGSLQMFGYPGATCDLGPCHAKVTCIEKTTNRCHYYNAIASASKAKVVVTNYDFWLNAGRNTDPNVLGTFDLLILDEAHDARNKLADFCAVEINLEMLRRYVPKLPFPKTADGVGVWATWASDTVRLIEGMLSNRENELSTPASSAPTTQSSARGHISQHVELTSLARSLSALAGAGKWQNANQPKRNARMPGLTSDWVSEETRHGIRWAPLWGHHYAERYLFRGIPRVVLTSATITEDSLAYLGISKAESDFIEVKSSFIAKRRPIYYVDTMHVGKVEIPAVRLSHRMDDTQRRAWMGLIDEWIDLRLHWKGIIHSVSYGRALEIIRDSRHSAIMMTHRDSRDLPAALERFRASPAPCILVSPSLTEGVDFPYDACRHTIIGKVPFIDTRSPLIKARVAADREYGNDVAAVSIMQGVGRGMRAPDDTNETLIADGHWNWFRMKIKWPKYYREAFRQVSRVPPPLDPEKMRVNHGGPKR